MHSSRVPPDGSTLWLSNTWMAGSSGAKTRFALLPGHDAVRELRDSYAFNSTVLNSPGRITSSNSTSSE